MVQRSTQKWLNYGEALAFIGNSLLSPMNQTEEVGLDPKFWEEFPDFGDGSVEKALTACKAYARDAQDYAAQGGDAVKRVSVEYTKLFVGPPRPAAAPWETVQRSKGAAVGFGEPTFEMQRLLHQAGLEVSNENNQYADHIGIELLYLSVLCTRVAESDEKMQVKLANDIAGFTREHPLGWIDHLIGAVEECEPAGYIASLLNLAKALLTTLA